MINATPRNGEGGGMSKHGDAIIKLTANLASARKELESLRGKVLKYKHLFDSGDNLKEMFDSLEDLFDAAAGIKK